ncbi:hypothetical protein [Treponema sp.]|uniref:hypothetical protein n=1 Tax=Treponema sp. TaxID=166 RepID=UPI003F0E37EC
MDSRIIFFQRGKIFLDSRMSGENFVRTGLAGKIRESGLLAKLKGSEWTFSAWNFDDTVSSADLNEFASGEERIFLEGACFDGFTLDELFQTPEKTKACAAVFAAFSFLDESQIPLCLVGAGGIVVSRDFSEILFLPRGLFLSALSCAGEKFFASQHGCYVNPEFFGKTALSFLQAVIVYKAVSGLFPFASENDSLRGADIRDLNYCPLRYAVFGADPEISEFTEKAFSGAKCEFPEQAFLSLHLKSPSAEEAEIFHAASRKFLLQRHRIVRVKRFFRSNSTIIKIAAVAVLIAVFASLSVRKTYMAKPTTKGLTSLKTLEMYYSAVNTLDVDSARACSENNVGSRVDRLANIFVTGKTSSMYNTENDLVPLSVWLLKNQTLHSIYGISRFTVDGIPCKTFAEGYKRRENPPAVSEENGAKISPGEKKSYYVELYILDSLGDDFISVSLQKELVTLEFKKDRWLICDFQTEIESQSVNFSEFKEDYSAYMKECGQDVFKCADMLREKYSFIPSRQELEDAEGYIERQYLLFLKGSAPRED